MFAQITQLSKMAVLLVLLPFFSLAQSQWQEDVHYQVIAQKASDTPQVREVFSFWCPHCFTFEAIASQLKQKLPEGVDFVKAHVDFMGTASPQAQQDATLAMLAAKVMGEGDKFNQALFNAIHKERKSIAGMSDIQTIFAAAGGNADKLASLSKSFGIKGQVARNANYIQGVRQVPAFIVNDKYKAIYTRDMTPDQFIDLLIWLSQQS